MELEAKFTKVFPVITGLQLPSYSPCKDIWLPLFSTVYDLEIAVLSLVLLTLTKVLPSNATSTLPPSTPSVKVILLSPWVDKSFINTNSFLSSLLQFTIVLPWISPMLIAPLGISFKVNTFPSLSPISWVIGISSILLTFTLVSPWISFNSTIPSVLLSKVMIFDFSVFSVFSSLTWDRIPLSILSWFLFISTKSAIPISLLNWFKVFPIASLVNFLILFSLSLFAIIQ